MEPPLQFRADDRYNTFPALDFKFRNPGDGSELITSVKLIVESCTVDCAPAMEYCLTCQDGDLFLTVYNHGYGPARAFRAEVDLGEFADVANRDVPVVHECGQIVDGARTANGLYQSHDFCLIQKDEINASRLEQLKSDPATKEPGFPLGATEAEEENGIAVGAFNARFSFRDDSGLSHEEEYRVAHVKRGAYGSPYIYLTESGFQYGKYRGAWFSLIPPSCEYQFLIDPDDRKDEYQISTAHAVQPGEFERIWIVVGAKKSAFLELRVVILTDKKRKVVSPPINLHIWNPRNTLVNSGSFQTRNAYTHPGIGLVWPGDQDRGRRLSGQSLTQISASTQGELEAYDVEVIKKTRYWSWGY